MKEEKIRLKVEIDLEVAYRLREGLTEKYLLNALAEMIESRMNGRGLRANNVTLTMLKPYTEEDKEIDEALYGKDMVSP